MLPAPEDFVPPANYQLGFQESVDQRSSLMMGCSVPSILGQQQTCLAGVVIEVVYAPCSGLPFTRQLKRSDDLIPRRAVEQVTGDELVRLFGPYSPVSGRASRKSACSFFHIEAQRTGKSWMGKRP